MQESSVSPNKVKFKTAIKLGITLFLATLLWLSLATVAIAQPHAAWLPSGALMVAAESTNQAQAESRSTVKTDIKRSGTGATAAQSAVQKEASSRTAPGQKVTYPDPPDIYDYDSLRAYDEEMYGEKEVKQKAQPSSHR